MPASDLNPNQLRRLLAALEVSKALVLDAIRGRSVRREDVADLRRTVIGVRRVLDALDEQRPWNLPPDPPEVT